jgi:hypothetical protein
MVDAPSPTQDLVKGSKANHYTVSMDDLRDITPLEAETTTYSPLHHYDFATNTARLGESMLKQHGFELNGGQYVITKDGGKLFMVQCFQHKDREDLKLSVAGRNSTDKSLASAVALGATVYCCTNLVINGTIRIFRKHTGDIYTYLQDSLILAFHKAVDSWSSVQNDMSSMQQLPLEDDEAFRIIGHMWGRGLLQPQQMTQVKTRWDAPEQEEFKPRNYWSLYNNITDVYKQLGPAVTMQKHLDLHRFTRDHILKTPDAILGDRTPKNIQGSINALRDEIEIDNGSV